VTAFASEDAFAELYYTIQAIKLVVGVTPTCWRPPYGDVDDRIRAIANGLGLQTILWGYDSNDWRAGTANITAADVDADYQMVINDLNSGTFDTVGAIMLTHELNEFTMDEAIKFHPMLAAAFEHLVPVGVAFNKTQPYVETNFALPTFEQYINGNITAIATASASSTVSTAISTLGTVRGASQTQAAPTQSTPASSSSGFIPLLHRAPWTVVLITTFVILLATV